MKKNQDSNADKAFSLDDILIQLQVVFRRFRLVVLCACFVLTIGLIYYCYARPIYRSVSSVECVTYVDPTNDQRFYGNKRGWFELKHRLATPTTFQLAAKSLDINMGYKGILRKYINRVRVYQDKSANNFTHSKLLVEVLSYDAEIGKQWAEALVNEFKQYRELEREQKAGHELENARSSMDAIAEEVANLEQEKIELEERMQYANLLIEQNLLKSLPVDINRTENAVEDMEKVISDLSVPNLTIKERFSILSRHQYNTRVGELIPRVDKIKNKFKDDQKTLVITPDQLEVDKDWIKYDQAYESLKSDLEEQSKKYGPSHPIIKEITEELLKAKRVLETKYEHALNAFYFDYDRTRSMLTDLRNKYPRYKQVSKDLQNAKRLLDDITKRVQIGTKKYKVLRDRVDKVEKAQLNDPIISISYLGLTETSDGSISPNKGKLLIYCAGGALLLGISMAYLLEYMDSSVKAPENIELELQIFGLGIVPELNVKGDVDLLQVHEAFPMFKESFRVIRTNLILRRDEMGEGQVMMLSSSMPQEGKSLCSLELARSFAELGQRTLLIDSDLRRGKQTRKLTGKKVAGLADFLTGKAQVEPVQFEENLDFLPAGHYSSQAIESLGGSSLKALIVGFKMQYDQIVIDGPPLLGLPDVFMMKEVLDGMVIVVSAGHTAFPQLKLAVEQVQKSKIPIHGFILNRVNFSTGGKYYRYYYRNYEYYNQGIESGHPVIASPR